MDGGETSAGIVEGRHIILGIGEIGEEITKIDRPARQKPVQRLLVETFRPTGREIQRSRTQIAESTEAIASGCVDKVLLPSTTRLKDRLYAYGARSLGGSESQLSVVLAYESGGWP